MLVTIYDFLGPIFLYFLILYNRKKHSSSFHYKGFPHLDKAVGYMFLFYENVLHIPVFYLCRFESVPVSRPRQMSRKS